MGEFSEISWTTHTFNPWMGCTKVSEACKFCYAERDMDHRYGKVQWGPSGTRVLTTDANWRKPLKWNREAEQAFRDYSRAAMSCQSEYDIPEPPERPRVFCASLADVFEDWDGPVVDSKGDTLYEVDGQFMSKQPGQWFLTEREPVTLQDVRKRLFRLIDATPHLDWLLLTKRPENVRRFWRDRVLNANADGQGHDETTPFRENVWLGTSVETQERGEVRIRELLRCRDMARVLFLSCEPLLGPVDLNAMTTDPPNSGFCLTDGWGRFDGEGPSLIDWVIAGGESGPTARPSHPDWFRDLRDQCTSAGVAFHFKQWGEWAEYSDVGSNSWSRTSIDPLRGRLGGGPLDGKEFATAYPWIREGDVGPCMVRVGKKNAGRKLVGREWDELPLCAET